MQPKSRRNTEDFERSEQRGRRAFSPSSSPHFMPLRCPSLGSGSFLASPSSHSTCAICLRNACVLREMANGGTDSDQPMVARRGVVSDRYGVNGELPRPMILFQDITLDQAISLEFWSTIWSTYALMDPAYQDCTSFGFWIDTGNGPCFCPCAWLSHHCQYHSRGCPLDPRFTHPTCTHPVQA
jgi:hypothetical protein